jgi:hypothetical protein
MTASLPQPLERAVIDGARQRKRTFLIIGLTLLGLGIVIAALVPLIGTTPLETRLMGAVIFGIGGFVLGAPFVALSFGDPAKAPLLQQLRARPADSIVWLYWFGPAPRDRTRSITVVLGFDDGQLTTLTTLPEQAETLTNALREYAPRATCDYSDALAEQFRTNPRSLRLD